MHRMLGFCETVRSVSFQTAGSWARTVFRFGAVESADTKDEVAASEANLNFMFTHSSEVQVAIALESWLIRSFGFSWVR